MIEVTAPAEPFAQAGEGTEGLLEAWLVAEQDRVSAGQPVADAIVVKTSFQITAPCAGTIGEILVAPGDSFPAGAVLARIEEEAAGAPPAGGSAAPVAPAGGPAEPRVRRVPLTGMRGAVAREMALAWQEPRVAIGAEVEMTAALAALAEAGETAPRLSPTAAVLRAVALTLRRHPRLNARIADEVVELAQEINLGVAVSLEEGVIVPVIRDADHRSIAELATEVAELAAAARSGSLPGTALRDATFTVSTLGGAGVDWFTPILNPPQVAILGVGRLCERVVARDGAPAVAPMMTLTLVFDHRALDGQPAALFIADLRDRLQRGEL